MSSSNLLLLFVVSIQLGLILLGLFVDSFQNLVGIGIYVEIHLFVVVFDEVGGVRLEKFIDGVVFLKILWFSGYDVNDHLFQRAFFG